MIERYMLPEMQEVWEETTKILNWVRVERAVVAALGEHEVIDQEDATKITEAINWKRDEDSTWLCTFLCSVKEREEETKHDVAAFVDCLSEYLEASDIDSRWVHYGLTSSDVTDTAFSMQMVEALDLITDKIADLEDILLKLANKHKDTPIMGRTHGMHAEPTTFGLIMLNYYTEFLRHMDRIHAATHNIKVGKLSGAVGTLSHLTPEIEEHALDSLGLMSAAVSNQVIQRDRHAQIFTTLAIIGGSVEKLALQIRHMQRTEVGEVSEGFSKGQKGSSAMPHKNNPILSENICGLARLLRGYAVSAMENIALWHERDISHSSVERVISPDAFNVLYFMIDRLESIMINLVVDDEQMLKNIFINDDIWGSQTVMLKLIDLGMTRAAAYSVVQPAAMSAKNSGYGFAFHLEREMQNHKFEPDEIKEVLDSVSLEEHLRNVDKIFERTIT